MCPVQNLCASPKVPLLLQTLQLKGRAIPLHVPVCVHCDGLWCLSCNAPQPLHCVRDEIALEFINCSIAMPWNLFGPFGGASHDSGLSPFYFKSRINQQGALYKVFFLFSARPEKPKYLFKSLNTEGSKHKYKVGQRTVHSRLSQSLSGGWVKSSTNSALDEMHNFCAGLKVQLACCSRSPFSQCHCILYFVFCILYCVFLILYLMQCHHAQLEPGAFSPVYPCLQLTSPAVNFSCSVTMLN